MQIIKEKLDIDDDKSIFIEKCTMIVQNTRYHRQECTIFLKYCAFFYLQKNFVMLNFF